VAARSTRRRTGYDITEGTTGGTVRGSRLPARIDGYGFRIQGANTVACDNTARGAAAGLANIACTPS
jgi:hypothetical protein